MHRQGWGATRVAVWVVVGVTDMEALELADLLRALVMDGLERSLAALDKREEAATA